MFWGKKIRADCEGMRSELDDHLDAINANTADVADVRESILALDEKIERVTSRIDELFLLLGAENRLTSQESALQAYLQTPRTLQELSQFLGDTPAAAERLLRALFLKGVAVHSVTTDGSVAFTTNLASTKHVSLSRYFDEQD